MEQCCMARFRQSLAWKIPRVPMSSCGCCAVWHLLCFCFFNLEQMTGYHQTSRVPGCFQTVGSRYDTEDPCGCAFFPSWVFPRHLAFGFFEGDFPWFPCIQNQVDRDFPEICLVKRPLSWMWRQQISAPWAENAPTFVEFLDVLLFLVGAFWEIWHAFAGELKCLN